MKLRHSQELDADGRWRQPLMMMKMMVKKRVQDPP